MQQGKLYFSAHAQTSTTSSVMKVYAFSDIYSERGIPSCTIGPTIHPNVATAVIQHRLNSTWLGSTFRSRRLPDPDHKLSMGITGRPLYFNQRTAHYQYYIIGIMSRSSLVPRPSPSQRRGLPRASGRPTWSSTCLCRSLRWRRPGNSLSHVTRYFPFDRLKW